MKERRDKQVSKDSYGKEYVTLMITCGKQKPKSSHPYD
jgi:hypothetical protein